MAAPHLGARLLLEAQANGVAALAVARGIAQPLRHFLEVKAVLQVTGGVGAGLGVAVGSCSPQGGRRWRPGRCQLCWPVLTSPAFSLAPATRKWCRPTCSTCGRQGQ